MKEERFVFVMGHIKRKIWTPFNVTSIERRKIHWTIVLIILLYFFEIEGILIFLGQVVNFEYGSAHLSIKIDCFDMEIFVFFQYRKNIHFVLNDHNQVYVAMMPLRHVNQIAHVSSLIICWYWSISARHWRISLRKLDNPSADLIVLVGSLWFVSQFLKSILWFARTWLLL
jgi:hypothetical protein